MAKKFTYGDQFSPEKIKWDKLLSFIKTSNGKREDLNKLIGNEYYSSSGSNKRTMAMNAVLSLNSYGILNIGEDSTTFTTTDLFNGLEGASSDPDRYTLFAQHILTNLEGAILVRAIDSMNNRGEELTLENINYELQDLGYDISPSCTYVSTMKAWLNKPGTIIEKNYNIDWNQVSKLVGIDKDHIDELYDLNIDQKYFLMSMLALDIQNFEKASNIASHTRNIYKIRLTTKMLVKSVIEPLEKLGLVETQKTTGGRGAKSHEIKLTSNAVTTLQIPLLEQLAELSGYSPKLLSEPFDNVVKDLKSKSKHVKGQALELLSIWLIRLLDLRFTGWRKRDKETGGAEVDVMAANDKVVYNRWQIQCKNTKNTIGVEVVAKEVGLTILTKADVVMIVTTSYFSKDAIKYANEVLSTSRYYVILLDGNDLSKIVKDKSSIIDILNTKARQVFNRREGLGLLN